MSQARREARMRLTAAKAFMLNEWQRKRLLVRPCPLLLCSHWQLLCSHWQ